MSNKTKLVFASLITPTKESEANALLLTESIRQFAGKYSESPVWLFTPGKGDQISSEFGQKCQKLTIDILPFDIDAKNKRFPFVSAATAAAKAERRAEGYSEVLCWLAANTLVLGEPLHFSLPKDKMLAYRPVHHKLIGSGWNEPLDSFWKWIYNFCGVSESSVFPMRGHIDDKKIRPYFNAGSLVLRPKAAILRTWLNEFLEAYDDEFMHPLYEKNELYAVFIHQAILSGCILRLLSKDQMLELPSSYNYPMHLFSEDGTSNRPKVLDDFVTIRHEGFYLEREWMEKIPVTERLKKWLQKTLIHFC